MNPLARVALILILTGFIAPLLINSELHITFIVFFLYGMAMVAAWLLKDPVILLFKKVRKILEELD